MSCHGVVEQPRIRTRWAGANAAEIRRHAFLQALGQLGWIIGRNVRIDTGTGCARAGRPRRLSSYGVDA